MNYTKLSESPSETVRRLVAEGKIEEAKKLQELISKL